MPLGPRDKSTLVQLTGWDATALRDFQLEDGTNASAVEAMLQSGMFALNAELSSGLWGSLISFTDQPDTEYRMGSSNGYQQHTEYGLPDGQRAITEGHMLPFMEYDRGLEWTYDYLKRARMPQITADIREAITDTRDLWRQKILGRLFQRGDDSGANKGLGSGGYSPGFATTAASTNVDYTPPTYAGNSFTSTHEHYIALAGGAFTADVFRDAKAELREHGHEPVYEFIIGPDDEATVRGLTGFTEVAQMSVNYGTNVNLAALNMASDGEAVGSYFIGAIHDFRVRVVPGIPQYYGFGWKSYGPLSIRNPLVVRADKGMSRPMVIATNDPNNGTPAHPLQFMMTQIGFGVGVADRTNGTARYVNNATWADGTPT